MTDDNLWTDSFIWISLYNLISLNLDLFSSSIVKSKSCLSSVFNNNSKDFSVGDVVDGHNEVIIYDFKTNEYSSYLSDSLKNNEVRTITDGRSQILPSGDLFVEETNYGRTLYFDSDGSLRWTHVNRAKNGNVYNLGWSRILYKDEDVKLVNNFLKSKGKCNDWIFNDIFHFF